MSLATEGKVIIEVGLNESTPKQQNPNVPYGPREVADDIIRCAGAGAAIVHFHARHDDGEQAWADADIYRRVMEQVAQKSDVVTYPSYFGDHGHVWQLSDDPPVGAPLLLASFDVAQEVTATPAWNAATNQFEAPGFETVGDSVDEEMPDARPGYETLLAEMARRGLRPTVGAFDIGEARWAALAVRAGILPTPLHCKVFLFERLVSGPFADPSGIDAYLAQLPDDVRPLLECAIVPYTMTEPAGVDALLHVAFDRGLNVRVGIGDNPEAYPSAHNAELVEHAIKLAAEHGLVPATPAEVRERLCLAPSTR